MKKLFFIVVLFIYGCSKEITNIPTPPPSSGVNPTPVETTPVFNGYKVNPNARTINNYWLDCGLQMDLIVASFQKPLGNNPRYGTFFLQIAAGDFNKDGWIDVFNPGTAWNGVLSNSTFLLWDTTTKTFVERNLFNDKTINHVGVNAVKSFPIYLNNDDYVDMVIFDIGDEFFGSIINHPIKLVLSDGKGGYDLKDIKTNEDEGIPIWAKNGSVGDLNGDKIPDLVIVTNMFGYIYWGINEFPYFTTKNRAMFVGDLNSFGYKADNSFGEKVVNFAGNAHGAFVSDVDKDGKNDIIICSQVKDGYTERIFYNQGSGRFNNQRMFNLPNPLNGLTGTCEDIKVEDINDDGLNDIIGAYNIDGQSWDIITYIQQKDNTFIIDNSTIVYTINSVRKNKWIASLMFYDINGDNKKDIMYINDADNPDQFKYKSVFIKTNNKFIEDSISKYDKYYTDLIKKVK